MTIDDVFVIKGRGIVVAGYIESGSLQRGAVVRLTGGSKPEFMAAVSGFNAFLTPSDTLVPIGILLRGVEREQVEKGMIVTTEGLEDKRHLYHTVFLNHVGAYAILNIAKQIHGYLR